MAAIHYFEVNKYTLNLVDPSGINYLLLSGFCGGDGSAYLTINSSNEGVPDCTKFSYHPKEKRFQYAFTDPVWTKLAQMGQGRPNKEKIKSKIIGVEVKDNLLCSILIDKSALFRKGQSEDGVKINFPENKIFIIDFCIENYIPVISHRFLDLNDNIRQMVEKEQKKVVSLDSKLGGGIAQLMNDYKFPWKMLCIGYGLSANI